jgi:large subunit ribosomal protein L23
MSAFWKKDKEQKKESEQKKSEVFKSVSDVKKDVKKTVKDKKGKKSNKKNTLVIPEDKAVLIGKVLLKPMISEAVMIAQELGKYTFKVTKGATKKEIALAIEALYKVSVEKVNTVNYKSQAKFFRGKKGSKKGYRKAVVTLKKGDKIKLFS